MSTSDLQKRHVPAVETGDYFHSAEGRAAANLLGGGALLIAALTTRTKASRVLAVAGGALVGRALLGTPARVARGRPARRLPGVRAGHGFRFRTAITVQCPAEQLYRIWRDLEGLPNILGHLASVRQGEGGLSHWVANGPLGPIEWDAQIINERVNELIAWQSLPGSTLATAGSVHVEKTSPDRGTILRISLKYDPPGGKLAATVASFFGRGLEQSIREDLRRFKQLLEAGEVATTKGQPQGGCARTNRDGRVS